MKTIKTKNYTLTYNDDEITKQKVFDRLMQFYIETELFSGESIAQSDVTYEEAPVLLGDLADDIIQFKVKWKE